MVCTIVKGTGVQQSGAQIGNRGLIKTLCLALFLSLGLSLLGGCTQTAYPQSTNELLEEQAAPTDRHQGYYYPALQSRETYVARVKTSPQAHRRSRIAFVTSLTTQQNKASAPPSFHLFAKGDEAQKFILTSVDSTRYRTLYQFRALLAAMTAFARTTPIFQESAAAENLTFLDLCKLMGVTQLTVTDGASVAHQIFIE